VPESFYFVVQSLEPQPQRCFMNYTLNIAQVMACDLPEKLQSLGMGNTPKGQVLMEALLNVEFFRDFIVVIG
jgi:hypothetical protein